MSQLLESVLEPHGCDDHFTLLVWLFFNYLFLVVKVFCLFVSCTLVWQNLLKIFFLRHYSAMCVWGMGGGGGASCPTNSQLIPQAGISTDVAHCHRICNLHMRVRPLSFFSSSSCQLTHKTRHCVHHLKTKERRGKVTD